jgi:hypothetical protein
MNFDMKQFCHSVNRRGKGYRNQAMELIQICRDLSAVSEQSPHQDLRLQGVLRACDVAIQESAVGSNVRGPITQKIQEAIRELLEYGIEFHPNDGTYENRMKAAKEKDKKSSKSNRISPGDRSLRVVRFQILRSLPDLHPNPIVAKQALVSSFELADILWNLIIVHDDNDDRRLSVAQNPHFYLNLPTLVNGTYQGKPVAELSRPYPDTIYVLTNNERRIYLEFGEMRRTFDHVWRTKNDALSFKDIIGKLESETTVEGCIPAPPLFWFRMNPPNFEREEGGETRNWRAPILELWDSPGTRIHIMN